MNRARLAAARAKLHEAIEILDEVLGDPARDERGPEDLPPPAKSAPRRKASPPQPINDIDKARARKALRKLGLDL